MSQAKVEKYKQEKANREKNNKKAKKRFRTEMCIFFAAIIVGVAVFVVAMINNRAASAAAEPIRIQTEAVDNYINSLTTEETSEEAAPEEAEAETAEENTEG